ncbi:MAG TPA: TetR family transcriptional regulator [Acidimicrobiales bacterium]|nr:TetR family transcriptional regulator [Acidimicrobiales bacterium]
MARPKRDVSSSADETRDRLRRAAHKVVCEAGIAGTSARAIASRAQVNQALIFYHFGTVSELLAAASDAAIASSIDHYRAAFDDVDSLDGLVSVARSMQARERTIGNVTYMAQMLSGSQNDPVLARAARAAVATWSSEVQRVLDRVLGDGPLTGLVDARGLAHLVSAGFIGIELYDVADPEGASRAVDTLEAIGRLVDVLDELGPVARRALASKTKRSAKAGRRQRKAVG